MLNVCPTYSGGVMEFIIGVAIGVVLTIFGELISHHVLKKYYTKEMAIQLKGLLLAIHDEVEVIWAHYQNAVGSELEKIQAGIPFIMTWRVSQAVSYTH